MALRYIRRITDHVRHDTYEPATVETIARDLGVGGDDLPALREAVGTLVQEGVVQVDGQGRVSLPRMGDEVVGELRKNARGFGFVKPSVLYAEGDVFMPPGEMKDAVSGDTVRVEVERVSRRGGEPGMTGRVVEVLRRKQKTFTGELSQRGGKWLVFPDGKTLTEPIVVPDAGAKHAKAGDKVVVEVLRFPEDSKLAEGVVVRVLGEAGKPDVETQAVIAAYNLPGEFAGACVEQAREAAAQFETEVRQGEASGFAGREDLRGEFVLTIDPPDAKDYDDAISISRPAGGGWELGVHIADVAHFIPPRTPLDEEAKERGNSVYLPRHVVPMLPEILSNGICSLQEGVVRFCKSAFLRYDRDGNAVSERVAATVIKSAKRLTYLEAQALIDGDADLAKKHAKTEPRYTEELLAALREMDACSRSIRERRRKQGMIHLELPDVVLIFDEHGHVVDAEKEDDAYTHTLIEMFMVEANEVLARLFEGVNVPLIRRVHPEPTPGDVQELQMYARVAGYKIPKSPTREELQALLEATAGTGAARAVHMAVLRTLTRAEYSPAPIGHFALASGAYAHFTSPIRRYADTTVHRALAEYLRLTDNGRSRPRTDEERKRLGERLRDSPMCPDYETLVEIGRHITRTEGEASDAENNLRQFLVLQLLSKHVGDTFEGVVTGVNPSGVFVQLEKYLADGMIKSADLPTGGKPGHAQFHGGRWRIDPRSGALVHEKSGRSYNIGDRVWTQIGAIDLARRKMDLFIADPGTRTAGKDKKVEPTKGGAAGGGSLHIDWDVLKSGRTGAERRAQRSKSRERSKQDFRGDRKDKGKRQ